MKWLLFLFLVLIYSGVGLADQDPSTDDVLEGFENPQVVSDDDVLDGFDAPPPDEEKDLPGKKPLLPGHTTINGRLSLETAYNHSISSSGITDDVWKGFSKLKTALSIDMTSKFLSRWKAVFSVKGYYNGIYALKGRDAFGSDVLDDDEISFETGSAYIEGSPLPRLDLKVGRQIVVWGKSDSIRITDVLNPLDLREPGVVDIRDLRLPVFMSRMDYQVNQFNFMAAFIHEMRTPKLPPFSSLYYPSEKKLPKEDLPDASIENTEFAAAMNGYFSGWDLSFYMADLFSHTPRIALKDGRPKRVYDRIFFAGSAGNIAFGNFLIKGELAFLDGLKFSATGNDTFLRVDGLIGVEYSGFSNMSISIERARRHINDYDSRLKMGPSKVKEDEDQTVLRITRDFLNDTLKATFLSSFYDRPFLDGGFNRLDITYDISDAFTAKMGGIFYESGDRSGFYTISDKDRIFAELSFSF